MYIIEFCLFSIGSLDFTLRPMIIFLKKLRRLKNICAYAWIFVFVCVFAYQYSAHRGQKLELEVVVVSHPTWVLGTECGSCWAISSISFPSLIFFWDRVLWYNPHWPGTHCIAQADLKLIALLLPQPPKCWGEYSCWLFWVLYYRDAPQPWDLFWVCFHRWCEVSKPFFFKSECWLFQHNLLEKEVSFYAECLWTSVQANWLCHYGLFVASLHDCGSFVFLETSLPGPSASQKVLEWL